MAQLSRRSTGYRPFITCDDPMGVVECGTIRNPKKIPTHKKIKPQRSKQKKLEIEGGKEEICSKEMAFGRGEEAQTPIYFQLMEVSSEEASDERILDSSDVPSTSSSQSLVVCSSNFVSKESPLPSTASWKKNRKPKCLNLMEKLMGLEHAFPRSLSFSPGNHIRETEKIVNQKWPEFDLVSPRAIKHEVHSKKPDWWRSTLIKIVEAVKLRGVFKSSQVKRVNYSSNSRFSCLDLEHPITPKTRGELDLENEEMLSYMRIRSNPLAQAYQKEKMRQEKVDASVNKNLSQEIGVVDDNAISRKVENGIRQMNEEMDTNCEEVNEEVETAHDLPSDINHIKDNKNSVHHDGSMEAFHCDNKLKDLLLSSPDFVKSVEELFDVKMNPYRGLQQTANDKILLDAATEIMEFYGSQYLRAHLPFQWTHNMSLRIYYYTCLDLVLDEACDWIKDLQCYKKVAENDLSDYSLVLLVKGDLNCRWMGIGVWDIGWRSVGSAEEFEEVVREIEDLVLSGLIEELILKQFHVYK